MTGFAATGRNLAARVPRLAVGQHDIFKFTATAAVTQRVIFDGDLVADIDGALGPTGALQAIRAADKGQLAISEEDGRFLRVLVGATKAQRILEIGGASGYSAIWMGLGLRETGGRLGFITPMTHNFCESCNRVRLTCTGTLYMCLGQDDQADFRRVLRSGADDDALDALGDAD